MPCAPQRAAMRCRHGTHNLGVSRVCGASLRKGFVLRRARDDQGVFVASVSASAYYSPRPSRMRRVPTTTGFSTSMTKRMRGRSVSHTVMVAMIGVVSLR
jgi:hypothetical protein